MALKKKYAVCNELFGSLPLLRSLELLAREGFQGVEIAPFTIFGEFTPADIDGGLRDLRRGLSASGLAFVGFHWLMVKPEGMRLLSEDPKTRERSWAHLRLLVDLAGELGGGVLVLGSPAQRSAGTTPKEKAREYFREGISQAAEQARKRKAAILLEPLPRSATDMVNTMEEASRWVRDIGSPGLSGMFDFHNTDDETDPWEVLISRYLPIIKHVHVNNRQGSWPTADAEGRDPAYRQAFKALRDGGYEGWVSLEIFSVPGDAAAVLRDTRAFLESVESPA